MTKRTKNLSLDPEAIARGESYGKLHGMSVSQLVSRFLSSLPLADDEVNLSPVVSRLLGIASSRKAVKRYRQHLVEKYGN